MTDKPQLTGLTAFIDAPHATEMFADTAMGVLAKGGNLCVTLGSHRTGHTETPAPEYVVVVGRVTMPLPQAQAMAELILRFMRDRNLLTEPPEAPLMQ